MTAVKKKNKIRRMMGLYTLFLMSVFLLLLLASVIAFIVMLVNPEVEVIEVDDFELPETINEEITEITDGQDLSGSLISGIPPESSEQIGLIDLSPYTGSMLPKVYEYDYDAYNAFGSDMVDYLHDDKRIIVIDPGHQDSTIKQDVWLSPYLNPDKASSWVKKSLAKIGTEGIHTGISEYETTHNVAKKLKETLEAMGFTVYLTKESVTERMGGPERAAVANKKNADLMISLHCDAYSDRSVKGASILAPEVWNGYPDEMLSYLSHTASQIVLSKYCSVTGLKNRGIISVSKVSMFSFSKVPSFLIELGFMSNPSEDKLLNDKTFQQDMVRGLAEGIKEYLDLVDSST